METMQLIEKKHPNLTNCIGNLEYSNQKCNQCDYIYPCMLMRRELKRKCFAPGKFRYGFGRKMIDKKRNPLWTGDIDDI